MTLASDGSGAFTYRVSIDGCPSSPVTMAAMVVAGSAGVPARVDGLVLAEQQFQANADPLACKLTVGGLQVKCVDIDGAWSAVFDRAPTNVTWLAANCDDDDTSIEVASTDGFDSAGYIWIDSECIAYTSVDSTHFLGCTRGALSDDADAPTYHYITDGVRLRSPEVTDWPVLWEQRRVRVWRYQESDLLTGDGTQVYLGLVSTSPQFNGVEWTFGVDSIVSILDQTLGADLAEPAYPRGVTYTEQWPLSIVLTESATATLDSAFGSSAYCTLVGFYESNDEFAAAFQLVVTARQAAAGQTTIVRVVSDGPSGWHMEAYTPGASPKYLTVANNGGFTVDPQFGGTDGFHFGMPQNEDGTLVFSVSASSTYRYYASGVSPVGTGGAPSLLPPTGIPGAGAVPRGAFSITSMYVRSRTFHLAGSTPLSSLIDSVLVSWPGEDDTTRYAALSDVDLTQRTITFRVGVAIGEVGTAPGVHLYTPESLPQIRFGLLLCEDHNGASTAGFLDTIVQKQQQYSTLGVVPMFRAGDYDAGIWTVTASSGQPALVTRRVYETFSPISLMDVISQELKLAGCFLAIDSSGRLVPKRLRLPAISELSSTDTIDETTLLTDEVLLSHEVGGLGQVNQVLMRTGYEAREDKWKGRTWITRDVSAFGQSPAVRQVTIEPKSGYVGPTITEDDVVQCAAAIFGTFAGSYAVDTLDVAMHDDVELGDVIAFDNPHYPDETGAIGVTGKVGLVLGRTTGVYSPRCRLTALTTKQKIGGYAPAAKITFWTLISGSTYDVLLGPTGSGVFPTGTDCRDWFAVGDRVKSVHFNTATGSSVKGVVTVVSSTTLRVVFNSDPGTPDAYLTTVPSDDADLTASQRRFCFIANDTGTIPYDADTAPAFRFGA